MQIELTRKFQKQVKECDDKRMIKKALSVIEAIVASDSMSEFPNLKKLTGYKNCFRIRLGSYRIGIMIIDKTVIFAAFDHRSDIYKYFP